MNSWKKKFTFFCSDTILSQLDCLCRHPIRYVQLCILPFSSGVPRKSRHSFLCYCHRNHWSHHLTHAQIMHLYFIHLLLWHQTCLHKHMVILFQPEKCKVMKQFNLVHFFKNCSWQKTRVVIFGIKFKHYDMIYKTRIMSWYLTNWTHAISLAIPWWKIVNALKIWMLNHLEYSELSILQIGQTRSETQVSLCSLLFSWGFLPSVSCTTPLSIFFKFYVSLWGFLCRKHWGQYILQNHFHLWWWTKFFCNLLVYYLWHFVLFGFVPHLHIGKILGFWIFPPSPPWAPPLFWVCPLSPP